MFSKFTISNCQEMALGADQELSNIHRYKWNDDSVNGNSSGMSHDLM